MATFSPEQIRAFLERIGVSPDGGEPSAPSGELLAAMHWAHLQAVPFENLDIVRLGREIRLDPGALYGKIVGERRGGYCFEVNGLLAVVLGDIGFGVRRVMVQFVQGDGGLSPTFDHLALIVSVPGGGTGDPGERWLVDVGSGRQAFARPLRMVADVEQYSPEVRTTYRLTREGVRDRWVLHTRVGEGEWAPWYAFDETERELADFAGRNAFFQTDEASPFRQGLLATRSRAGGRVTVTGDRLIGTVDGVRSEREIGPEEVEALLASEFGIVVAAAPGDGASGEGAR